MKISALSRIIPTLAATALFALAAPTAALAEPGSGAGTGTGDAGGSGFSVDNHGTIHTPQNTSTDDDSPAWYPNCAAVRAAGKAPLYSSDPGYNGLLDPDGTGVACGPGSTTP